MEIKSFLIDPEQGRLETLYKDIDSFEEYLSLPIRDVQAYCFYKEKLIVVYAESKGYWMPPGGGIEEEESVEEAAVREILEETNMRVIAQRAVGLFKIFENDKITHQARTVCIVEPIGSFQSSPDEEVTEVKLIDPADLTQYFDWGEVGAHQFKRALELCAEIRESR